MRDVELLYQLQEFDEGIALYERKMQEWGGRLQTLHRTLNEARRSRQEGEKALHSLEARLRQVEGTLWEQEGRLKETEKRLYSDTIHSEREAQAVQSQVEQARQHKDELESEALQLMMEKDERRAQLDGLLQEEERCIRGYEALAQETTAQETLLQEQVEPLRTARAGLVTQIAPPVLALYEQVRRTGGKPVVRLVNNSCGGCRVDVPLLRRKALAAGELVRCENCGKILLL